MIPLVEARTVYEVMTGWGGMTAVAATCGADVLVFYLCWN